MAGAPVISSVAAAVAVTDSHPGPCLSVDALPLSSLSLRSGGKTGRTAARPVELSSSFVGTWHGRRPSVPAAAFVRRRRQGRSRRRVIVDELAGQYEEGFEDVHGQIINYFTFKAVRTVLNQLYEMNPPNYRWFHNFIATNRPNDGKRFLRLLLKEKQDLAERVMITRLHLYGKWIKKCDHARMYQKIQDDNLELMRERLVETIIWPNDDTNTELIG